MTIQIWHIRNAEEALQNPGIERKTCEKGHSPYVQPERGHTRSLDYGSVSKVAQKDTLRTYGVLPLPHSMQNS